ncbi:MAG: hypothetical protein CL862_04850 [Cyanobium sp. NAT70]|nr:hypothetical protein [Cyanobium sp. NAT70]
MLRVRGFSASLFRQLVSEQAELVVYPCCHLPRNWRSAQSCLATSVDQASGLDGPAFSSVSVQNSGHQ